MLRRTLVEALFSLLRELCCDSGTLTERFLMFGLDPCPRYRLSRPPLVQAFGQVRFPVRAKLPSLEGVAPVQERLDDVFPYMNRQEIQQVALLVGPGRPAAAEGQTSQSWRFNDDAA